MVDADHIYPTRLDIKDGGILARHTVVINLPDTFPNKPVPAGFQITCTRVVGGQDQPEYIKVYGIGCGPTVYGTRAAAMQPPTLAAFERDSSLSRFFLGGCGRELGDDSFAVDQLTLDPSTISVKQGDKTDYRFHARQDFSNSGVEFYRFWKEGRVI